MSKSPDDSTSASTASTATPKPTHTPGPWHAGFAGKGAYIRQSGDVFRVVARTYNGCDVDPILGRANAHRIVACVNACEGLDPAEVATLIKHRDVLLSVLLSVLQVDGEILGPNENNKHWSNRKKHVFELARKAIGNATPNENKT